uniref:SAS-6_N domain-containing protein n=1 Tax=Caenorhabditis tropicalis TaxID=1561998 RepID=A0A1I7UA10_9PELO
MTSKLALFDQTLNASLHQPLSSNNSDFKAYKTRVKLKILEQRSETTGEKELKFEISRSDDFEFLFAEILNNEKYQTLAREHDLIVDFDTFPKVIIQHLLCKNIVKNSEEDGETDARKKPGYHSIIDHGKPTEINIILDSDRSFCSFELYSKTPISKGRIFSMKLSAVRGDHLISHLLKICSSQAAKLSGYHKTSDELEALRTKCGELEKENRRLGEMKERCEEETERIRELEDELELVKEERETIRVLADERQDEVAEMQAEVDSAKRELELCEEERDIVAKMLNEEQNKNDYNQKEIARLRADNVAIRRNLEKADKVLKRNDAQQNQQSLDVRKLRELEADLKEKDSMVDSLTGTIGMLRKELEEEKLKLAEVMDSFERLKTENEGVKERLLMYRNQRFSPAPTVGLTPLGLPTTTLPAGYKTVLGPNSPYANPNNMRTPFRDATFQNQITPHHQAIRFNSQLNDDTNGSSMTHTPPVLRNPQ